MSNDFYYFQHNSSARTDPKIMALINKYGIEGYGRYWILLECMRKETGYKIKDKEYNWLAIAQQFLCTCEDVKIFVRDCVEEFELFIQDDGFFYSESLLEKMLKLDDIRKKRSIAASSKKTIEDTWRDS